LPIDYVTGRPPAVTLPPEGVGLVRRRTPIALLALLALTGTSLVATSAAAAPAKDGSTSLTAAADALVAGSGAGLFKSPDDSFVRTGQAAGSNGLSYLSYERTYRGLPVVGGDLVVVTNAAGKVLHTAVAQNQIIKVGTVAT